jgi:hypothetical protein
MGSDVAGEQSRVLQKLMSGVEGHYMVEVLLTMYIVSYQKLWFTVPPAPQDHPTEPPKAL